MVDSFRKLETWKESINLATKIYQITKDFPKDEQFGITSQIRRASVSVSCNISEGAGLNYIKNKLNHYDVASGSCNEVENLAILAQRLGYINEQERTEIEELVSATRKPLTGLIKFTQNKIENNKY
jgi:four helix bundle protein